MTKMEQFYTLGIGRLMFETCHFYTTVIKTLPSYDRSFGCLASEVHQASTPGIAYP
jgi:hypothetical protein